MELKKRISLGKVFAILYILAFAVYLVIGLQPAEATKIAESKEYTIISELNIPSINLLSDVTTVKLTDDGLETPDTIVGKFSNQKNKIFLFGHSSTVFKDLDDVKIDDAIWYDSNEYKVVKIETLKKEEIRMSNILKEEKRDTIVIMTCAGVDLGDGDATHRLLVTAIRD